MTSNLVHIYAKLSKLQSWKKAHQTILPTFRPQSQLIHTAHRQSQIQKRLLFVSSFAATHIQVIHNTHTLHPQQQTKDSMWLLSLYSKSSKKPYVASVIKKNKIKKGNPTLIPSLSERVRVPGGLNKKEAVLRDQHTKTAP